MSDCKGDTLHKVKPGISLDVERTWLVLHETVDSLLLCLDRKWSSHFVGPPLLTVKVFLVWMDESTNYLMSGCSWC